MEDRAEEIKEKLLLLGGRKVDGSCMGKKTMNEGFTQAVKNRDMEIVRQALECKVISHVHFGHVLNKAVLENDKDALELLLVGASEDTYYKGKERVLKKAAEIGNLDIVKWLTDSGMEIRKSNDAIKLAMKNNHCEVLEYLLKRCANINDIKNGNALMNFLISHNRIDAVRYMIEEGYDIYKGDCTKCYGNLPLAASRGNLEIFKYLFEETGKHDKKLHKLKLFCGIYYGTVDIVKYVMDNMDADDETYVKRIMKTYCLGNRRRV